MSNQPARRVPADTIAVADFAAAKTSTVAAAPKALPAPQLRFEALRDTLRDDCRSEADGETSLAAKEAFFRTNECIAERMKKARVDHLIASRPDPEHRASLLALEDSYDKLTEKVCALSEEAIWLNFETGQRDWGSLNGYALLACEQRSAIERTYFMKTMARGDIAGLVGRIRDVEPIGERQRAELGEKRDQMRALFEEPEPDPVDNGLVPLNNSDKRDLVGRIDGIMRETRHHATDTCTTYPKLSEAFGDVGACEAALSSYYASMGRFDGEMFEDPGSDD